MPRREAPLARHDSALNRQDFSSAHREIEEDLLRGTLEILRLMKDSINTATEPVKLSARVLQLLIKHAQRRGGSRAPNPTALSIIKLCEKMQWLIVQDPESRGRSRLDLTAFPQLRVLRLEGCRLSHIDGVESLAQLQLVGGRCEEHMLKFRTLRHLTFTLGSIDPANLSSLCFSLRTVTVEVPEEVSPDQNTAPLWAPNAQFLKFFEQVAHDVLHWEALEMVTVRGTKRSQPRTLRLPALFGLDVSWRELRKLRSLQLSSLRLVASDTLVCLDACVFLERLDLSDNCFTSIDAAVLPPSISLLNLAGNRLRECPFGDDGLRSLTKLESLDLSANEIAEWPDLRVLEHNHLRHLNVLMNPITAVSHNFSKDTEVVAFIAGVLLRNHTLVTVNNMSVGACKSLVNGRFVERYAPLAEQRMKPAIPRRRRRDDEKRKARTMRRVDEHQNFVPRHLGSRQEADAEVLREQYGESYLAHVPVSPAPPALAADGAREAAPVKAAEPVVVEPQEQPPPPTIAKPKPQWQLSEKAPPPLFERFLKSLQTADWIYHDANDARRKGFPSGLAYDDVQLCDENAALWELSDVVTPHSTSREIILRDARDPQMPNSQRYANRLLVRVVETRCGDTRYVRVETKTRDEAFNDTPLPLLTMTLEATHPTAILEVDTTAAISAHTALAGRERSSTMGEQEFEVRSSGMFVELISNARCVHHVAPAVVLAAFAVPVGPVAQLFCERLKAQLLACHAKLCTNGIVREWPLYLDHGAVRNDGDQSLPVAATLPRFLDRLRAHQDEDPSRQRLGCDCVIPAADELLLILKSYIFRSDVQPRRIKYLCTAYVNRIVHDTAAPRPSWENEESCILVVTPEELLFAQDRNFTTVHRGAEYVDPEDTFTDVERIPLRRVTGVRVSFDMQSFGIALGEQFIGCYPRETNITLSVVSALAQVGLVDIDSQGAQRRKGRRHDESVRPDLAMLPCPYPALTTAPLVFAVNVFLRHPVPPKQGARSYPYPLRHLSPALAAVMHPVTVVIASGDVVLLDNSDHLDARVDATPLQRTPVGTVVGLELPPPALFPLLFALSIATAGNKTRWLCCAQHPNTIALLVAELRRTRQQLPMLELAAHDCDP